MGQTASEQRAQQEPDGEDGNVTVPSLKDIDTHEGLHLTDSTARAYIS